MSETIKKCPLCAEEIPLAAADCPYCGALFKISSDGYCLNCHEFRQADESGNCKTCGKPVADWRVESTFIGEPSEPAASPPAAAMPALERSSTPAWPAKKSTSYRWIIIIAILILGGVLVVVGGAFLLGLLSRQAAVQPAQAITPTTVRQVAVAKTPTKPVTSAPDVSDTPVLVVTLTPTLGIGSSIVSEMDGMIMLYVPAGEFPMGSADDVLSAFPNERPQHTVYLDAFWIDQTEVTNAQYGQCVAAGKCPTPSGNGTRLRKDYFGNPEFGQYPATNIAWDGANAYCVWAGRRLPTEAEWEKSARGVDGRLFAWGDEDPSCQLASWGGTGRCQGDTSAVGSSPDGASPYGALDMTGNAWEWVQDWFSALYYAKSPAENPGGPPSGYDRVLRGGSWANAGEWLRVTYRGIYGKQPITDGSTIGFRCAMSAEAVATAPAKKSTAAATSPAQPVWVTDFAGPILANVAGRPPNFKDDISSEKNSRYYWGTNPGITFENGSLHLTATNGGVDAGGGRTNDDTPDFVLEFELTPRSIDALGGIHVLFRHSDKGYYALGFFRDSRWNIVFTEDNTADRTITGGKTDLFGIDQTTKVTLIVQQDEMALYLNGQPAGYGRNIAPMANHWTYSLYAPGGMTTADIDNVRFWNLNSLKPNSE